MYNYVVDELYLTTNQNQKQHIYKHENLFEYQILFKDRINCF